MPYSLKATGLSVGHNPLPPPNDITVFTHLKWGHKLPVKRRQSHNPHAQIQARLSSAAVAMETLVRGLVVSRPLTHSQSHTDTHSLTHTQTLTHTVVWWKHLKIIVLQNSACGWTFSCSVTANALPSVSGNTKTTSFALLLFQGNSDAWLDEKQSDSKTEINGVRSDTSRSVGRYHVAHRLGSTTIITTTTNSWLN